MKCDNCGKCCMDVIAIMLLPSDYKEIVNIDENIDKKVVRVAGLYFLMPDENNVCPFFNLSTKKCTIYEWRPKVCKIYPFSYRKRKITTLLAVTPSNINPEMFYLTLCERFWTISQEDYKESIEAIHKVRKEQYNLGILSKSDAPTEKEKQIRKFEETLTQEKKEKNFPFDLYLQIMQRDRVLGLVFLKLFDAYFDAPESQKNEYEAFIAKYIYKFESEPEMLGKAVQELKRRWKEKREDNFDFTFTIN